MAKGDQVGTLINVSATSTALYQPSGTVEVLVRTIVAGTISTVIIHELYDGTNSAPVLQNNEVGSGHNRANVAIMISNSMYFRFRNNDTVARVMGFTGIQTK